MALPEGETEASFRPKLGSFSPAFSYDPATRVFKLKPEALTGIGEVDACFKFLQEAGITFHDAQSRGGESLARVRGPCEGGGGGVGRRSLCASAHHALHPKKRRAACWAAAI